MFFQDVVDGLDRVDTGKAEKVSDFRQLTVLKSIYVIRIPKKSQKETDLEQVYQLSVCRTHLVWVHDLIPPSELEQSLEEHLVPLEVPILEQLLTLFVVGSEKETG